MAANQQPIANDPHAYLSAYVTLAPSTDALMQLSGPVAAYIQEQEDPTVAAMYLSAVARHMGMTLPANDDLRRQRTQVLEAVGTAATKCNPRGTISQSGILPALVRWMHASPETLTPAHVEFLQCSVLACQYRYARRMVGMEWPRPTRISIVKTLRYYYMRGLVHMGCEEWQLAVRSFWICMSVPVEGVSAILIAAWKKMVLCQCLLGCSTSVPGVLSNAVSRVLTSREGDAQNVPAYRDLIKSFEENDRAQVMALQQTQAAAYESDGTTGMVERLATEALHRRVRHLASVYSVISVQQLSKELQVPVADLPLLLSQVEGLTAEEVDESDFLSLELEVNNANLVSQDDLLQLMDLTEQIQILDASISSSSRYQHLKNTSSRASAVSGPLGVAEL